MPRPHSEALAIAKRQEIVADLYLQGTPQAVIGHQVDVSQSTVSSDLKAIKKQWRESAVRDFDTVREVELRKLDRIEREAWEAWRRSQNPLQTVVLTTGGSDQKTTVRDQVGDPRFLEQVFKCVASRRAMLGLDAPTRIAPTSPDGEQAYHAHVMTELMRLAEESKDGPLIVDAQFVEQEVNRKLEDHRSMKDDETISNE